MTEFLDTSPTADQGEEDEASPENEQAVYDWLVTDGGNMTVAERIAQAEALDRDDIVEALKLL
jgi:hypothetical protein